MKLVLSLVTIFMAAAASRDGRLIRGSSTDASAAVHVAPADIFAGLAGNNKCNNNNQCQSLSTSTTEYYCQFTEGDCGDEQKGVCTPIPTGQQCNGVEDDKVCGCNNVVYKNSCKAYQSGTSIQNQGSCANEVTCKTNNQCKSLSSSTTEYYCKQPEGECSSKQGVCTPVPTGEDCDNVQNNAVCGCDQVKYKNYCVSCSKYCSFSRFAQTLTILSLQLWCLGQTRYRFRSSTRLFV